MKDNIQNMIEKGFSKHNHLGRFKYIVGIKSYFMIVATAHGVEINATEDLSGFSLFNSPYHSHKNLEAIDLIPNKNFGEEALSPVNGVVEKILKFKVKSVSLFFKVMDVESTKFEAEEYEHVILIRSRENKKKIVKILHVKPTVKEGDRIYVNDPLGTLVRTKHYSFWAAPHLHVEVRNENDAIRARGACRLNINILGLRIENGITHNSIMKKRVRNSLKIVSKILEATDSYIEVESLYNGRFAQALVGGKPCILDCGIPHMGYGGVISIYNIKPNEDVYFNGIKIGKIVKSYGKIGIFDPTIKIKVNNIPMRGISFILGLKNLKSTRIVFKKRENLFEKNKKVEIEVYSDKNDD